MKLSRLFMVLTALSCVTPTFASDFNLPFVNAAGLGTAYADWATSANDASTLFTNPAGLTQLKHQQLVFSGLGILGNTKFTGTSITPSFPFPAPVIQSGSASSRIGAFMPSFYYSIPINNQFTFGFGQTTPFALGSSYAKDSIVRYASTRSRVVVIDISPSIGYKVSNKLSVGFGLDANRIAFTLNNMYGPPISSPDSEAQNHLSGWGIGWHTGALYQPFVTTRVGISFNSMVSIHTTGDSEAYAPFGTFRTTNQKTNARLPARTQLSFQQDLSKNVTAMGTVFYTNWETFQKITMKRVMVPGGGTVNVSVPFEYHNTFDYALGLNFKPCDKWILRTGIQFLTTPSNDRDRAVADPVGRATILAVGAHYQQNATLGYDIGYGHSFFKEENVNLTNAVTALNGYTNTQTNVLGAQITWDIV